MEDQCYNIIKMGLNASTMRQKAISSNIANVNTPEYKAFKVEFESQLKKALGEDGISMKKTNDKHLGGADASSVSSKVVRKTDTSMNENGNNVDVDNEMVDMASNVIYYSALVSQLNMKLGSMNYVINK